MENAISDCTLRKLLMLDFLEGEKSIKHDLFPSYSYYNYLFIGPKRSGKTSLLFEYAFQIAEHAHNVLYITRTRLEKLPHFINPREQPNMSTLKRIEILYLESVEEFLRVMITVHLRKKKYELVIVDGIDEYFIPMSKDSVGIAAKLCSFACDAVAYLRKCGLGTMFLTSMTSSTNTSLHTIRKVMENWIPNTIYFYPHHRGRGFTIKSQTSIVVIEENDDVDVKGVHSEIKDGMIVLQ